MKYIDNIVLFSTILFAFLLGFAISEYKHKFHESERTLQINYVSDTSIHYLFLDVTEKSPYYFEVNSQEEFTEPLNMQIIEIFDYDFLR